MTPKGSVDVSAWSGLSVVDSSGRALGTCSETYADAQTGGAEWLLVARPDGSFRIVPVAGAARTEGRVQVGFAEDVVVASPSFGAPAVLTADDETRLYAHYDVGTASGSAASAPAQAAPASAPPTSGPSASEPDKLLVPARGPLVAAVVVTLLALLFLRRHRRS